MSLANDDLSIPLTCDEKPGSLLCDACDEKYPYIRVKKLSWEGELAAYNGGQVDHDQYDQYDNVHCTRA